MTKGFITVATGNEEYFILARNLLHSYHYFCDSPLPFAILTDRKNEWTKEFDDVILLDEGATNSYLDKLLLAEYSPYDITIFIDADCLAFGNLNHLFEYFAEADDFSCFGRVLPLMDKTGWFEYENLGNLKSQISYIIGLHGGIYYMRKGIKSRKVLSTAMELVPDYPKFKFKGKFENPGDEPLVALSMALNGCKPIPFVPQAITCYWEHVGHMHIDVSKGLATIDGNKGLNLELVHWGTRYTRTLEYKKQISLLKLLEEKPSDLDKKIQMCKRQYDKEIRLSKAKQLVARVKNKLFRVLGKR